jgi:DNA-binding NarL/FixJ family response regulator
MKILPPRQIEILKMVSFGLTNQEIANSLGIEKKTVEAHIQHIFKNLNVRNRVCAAVFYVNHF